MKSRADRRIEHTEGISNDSVILSWLRRFMFYPFTAFNLKFRYFSPESVRGVVKGSHISRADIDQLQVDQLQIQ